MDEEQQLELLENGEEEFWSRFYQERGDLRDFAIKQIDLFHLDLLQEFRDRLNVANWKRITDPGFELARNMMYRVLRRSVSTQIVVSMDDFEKKVKRVKEKERKKEKKKAALLVSQPLSPPPDLVFPATTPLEAAVEKKAQAKKKHDEWVSKQNDKFEAGKASRDAAKAERKTKKKAAKARRKALKDEKNANRVGLSSLGGKGHR